MKKVLILILIGGLAAGLALPVYADLTFSAPHVGRLDNQYIEVGATATIRVVYTNATAGSVNIDAAKLYIDFVDSVIDTASVSVANSHPGNLTVQENVVSAGSIRYQLQTQPTSGQTPLTVAAGASVDLAVITLHVNQGATVGNESYFIRFTTTDQTNNVKVVQEGNPVTGTISNGAAIHLEGTQLPTFGGLNTATDTTTGNSVNLNWAASETGAGDKRVNAETLYPSGTKLRYSIFRAENDTVGPRIQGPDLNQTTSSDTGLNDNTHYWYAAKGQDNCSLTHNLDPNSTTKQVVPHDFTPPGTPANFVAASADTKLTLSWVNPTVDFDKVVLIRKIGAYPSPTFTNAGPPPDGTANGTTPPTVNSAPPGDANAKVVYVGNGTSFPDSGLVNGTVYYYRIYAYDPVGGTPNQQGYNYSAPAQVAQAPGVAPDPIAKFYAISRINLNEITLKWNNSPNYATKPQGGTVIWYTTNINKWSAIPENPSDWADATKMQGIKLLTIEPRTGASETNESITLTKDAAGTAFSTQETYFFKAFAYNQTTTPPTASDLTNATKIAQYRFSSGVMAAAAPTTGGAGGGGPVTITLTKISGGMGVNSVGIPANFPLLFDDLAGHTSTLNNLQDLIAAINSSAGAGTVTASAYWDGATQKLAGASYSTTGSKTYSTAGFDETKISLVGGKGYYLSVSRTITFKLSPVR